MYTGRILKRAKILSQTGSLKMSQQTLTHGGGCPKKASVSKGKRERERWLILPGGTFPTLAAWRSLRNMLQLNPLPAALYCPNNFLLLDWLLLGLGLPLKISKHCAKHESDHGGGPGLAYGRPGLSHKEWRPPGGNWTSVNWCSCRSDGQSGVWETHRPHRL